MYNYSVDSENSGDFQSSVNVEFSEVNTTISELATKLSLLKENISNYWEGPAAANYFQLLNSIELETVQALIKELENEILLAQSQMATQQDPNIEV